MRTPFDLETTDRLLTTTRAVRKRLDLDRPVPRDVLLECIAIAQQAPTGSNEQGWRWLVVTEGDTRAAIAAVYARGRDVIHSLREQATGQTRRVYDSAAWLVDHLADVPVHVIPCIVGRPPEEFSPVSHASCYGSIFPAVWSFQLALRARGLGSVLTTLHLIWEQEVAEILGIPGDVLQVGLLPVAYTVGTDFRPARRPSPESITHFDRWDDFLATDEHR
jgi:nitroreductase